MADDMAEGGDFSMNNKGVSLIEVLVTMLILAVIIVPTLRTIITSANTNKISREEQYATNVAQNMMETVKGFGFEDIKEQMKFWEEGGSFTLIPSQSRSADFKVEIIPPAEGETGKSYYRIEGVKEGTDEFDIKLSFNSEVYKSDTGKKNNYSFPDISSFGAEDTAMIYLGTSALGEDYDRKAAEYFYSAYVTHIEELNEIERIKTEEERLERQRKYEETNDASWLEPITQKVYATSTEAEVVTGKFKRNIIVNITKEMVPGSESLASIYLVEAYASYDISIDKAGAEMLPSVFTMTKDYSYDSYKVEFKEINNLYIFYEPYLMETYGDGNPSDTITLNTDSAVYSEKGGTDKINVFIAVQKLYDSYDITRGSISVPPACLNCFNLYCTASLTGINPEDKMDKLYTELAPKDRIYDVTVEVYRHGDSVPVAVLDSAIVE